ncbi:carboxymuconolactone decarboxylase [Salimicrobium jeotgali]|uniref:Carboxymuconolactone decarboxylase n=2 Tax=Salimicrobium jeotgali TaxID=1230341 RepID=K2HBA5_9BACI|nr:carboxymuconolactone decarboxylase [Salimicrobium jeotgali]EKE32840.1 carboxymuconolactone decarboxylase [Salimicrobium jeotgali]
MMENSRYEAGQKVMEELFSEQVRQEMKGVKDVSPDLWDMIVSFGFGDLYSREGLSLSQREIVTITSLITQGAFDQLKVHLEAALNVGLSREEITEIIIQCTGYVGFPKAIHAMQIAAEVFQERSEYSSR